MAKKYRTPYSETPLDPAKIPQTRQTIDSHSSMVTNLRLNKVFEEVDRHGIVAKQRWWYPDGFIHVSNYFATLDQLYMSIDCIAQTLKKDDGAFVNPIRNKVEEGYRLLNKIISRPTESPSVRLSDLKSLLELTREVEINIKSLLQQMDYFFRTSKRLPVGLKYIGMYQEHTLFNKEEDDEGVGGE